VKVIRPPGIFTQQAGWVQVVGIGWQGSDSVPCVQAPERHGGSRRWSPIDSGMDPRTPCLTPRKIHCMVPQGNPLAFTVTYRARFLHMNFNILVFLITIKK